MQVVSRLVPLRIPCCRFLRLLLHEPYRLPRRNPHHQLALHSLHLIGDNMMLHYTRTQRRRRNKQQQARSTTGGGQPPPPLLLSPQELSVLSCDREACMRAAVLQEIGVSPTIIESVVLLHKRRRPPLLPSSSSSRGSGTSSNQEEEEGGEEEEVCSGPFTGLELRAEELRFVRSQLLTWRTRYLLHLPSASSTADPALLDPILHRLRALQERAAVPGLEAKGEEAVRAVVREAGELFRAVNKRLAESFREIVGGTGR